MLRPGGELSVDLSGPHDPGRFPSDLQEHNAIRPQYFATGVYRTISSGELQQREDNERHAEQCVRPEEAVPGENAAAASPRKGRAPCADSAAPASEKNLYFARFPEGKSMQETGPALEDIVNEVNNLYKCKAVWRIHSDRAGELASPSVKAYFRQKGVRVTSTAGY